MGQSLFIPIYFYISQLQAKKLSGFRRNMRSYRETKNSGIIGLIESITVIKSFVREPLEAQKHKEIQDEMTSNQMSTQSFFEVLDAGIRQNLQELIDTGKDQRYLTMQHVDFRYPDGTKALHDVSLVVPHGKITALVGLSGAGKSTIINLLDKFYQPASGTITLDGIDLQEFDTPNF
ncbi:hypothetical protein FQR65_LT19579 [Abscondita terminalis]|nr:hypothetical protein FQR65_LT19579 [Abscondita terminalis]